MFELLEPTIRAYKEALKLVNETGKAPSLRSLTRLSRDLSTNLFLTLARATLERLSPDAFSRNAWSRLPVRR
jgi:hypothetical protein